MTRKKTNILFYLKIFTVSLFLICTNLVFGQQFVFKVLTTSGNVDFRSDNSREWNQIKTGEPLFKNYEIQLGKNSYAALMYNDGRTLELTEKGIFKIGELSKQLFDEKKTVTQKFASYIAKEIITDKSEKKSMRTFAAVVRVKPNHIESAVPSLTRVLESKIDLVWYSYPASTEYLVSIMNEDNSIIFMDVIKDTSFSLDSKTLNLYKEKNYKWFVSDASNSIIVSDTNSISFLSEENKSKILDTLKLLDDEKEGNDSPMKTLSLACFYESNILNIDALHQYKKMISLYSASEEYKKLFAKFLLKYKLFVKASELLAEE